MSSSWALVSHLGARRVSISPAISQAAQIFQGWVTVKRPRMRNMRGVSRVRCGKGLRYHRRGKEGGWRKSVPCSANTGRIDKLRKRGALECGAVPPLWFFLLEPASGERSPSRQAEKTKAVVQRRTPRQSL